MGERLGLQTTNPVAGLATRPADLRLQNSRNVLGLVRQYAPCSRAELARLSGLSAPTVAAAVAELVDRGLVEFLGEGPSSGGRPPELLRFCPQHRFVAAADIGGTRLCCGLLLLLFGLWPLAFTGLLTQSSPASKRANEPFLMALKSAAVVIESLFQFPSTSRARASG